MTMLLSLSKFICYLDTIAPGFFLLGLIFAVFSFEWELIGGMASRGKTRPNVSGGSSSTVSSSSSSSSTAPPPLKNKKTWVESYLYGSSWSVPKSFFLHYYLAGTISLVFILMYYGYCDYNISNNSSSKQNIALTPVTIALFIVCIIHCLRRSYECYYVHVFSPTAKMHSMFYITAVLYYVLIPANIFELPLSCTATNGRTIGVNDGGCYRSKYDNYITAARSQQQPSNDKASSVTSIASIVAVTCFCLWAQYQQTRHHIILANLRRPGGDGKQKKNASESTNGANSYQIPMGGWFEYVTCPHYFAEVLLYVSYFILIAMDERLPNLPRLIAYYNDNTADTTNRYVFFMFLWECRFISTFLFVAANLQFAAIDNHNWYCTKFENYQKLNRKTMFPFLY